MGNLIKRTLLILSVFIISIKLIISVAFAQEDVRTIRVGVYDNKPKIYRNEDGEIKGLFADIVNYVAENEGWKVEYVHGTWDEGLSRLESNQIDVMVDVAVSEERRGKYDFNNETVLINWAAVYTRKGLEIHSLQDLAGKDVAVMKSGIHFEGPLGIKNLTDSFDIDVNFVDVGVYSDVFELLDKKEVDAGVVNRVFGVVNESDYNVVRSNIVFNPISLRFAFTKDDPDNNMFIERFDSRLMELKSDPDSIYYESLRTYLPGFTVRIEEETPGWVIWVLATLVTLLLWLLTVFVVTQRYQKKLEKRVERRTYELEKSNKKYRELYKKTQKKLDELEILMRATVDRELKMKELKERLKEIDG